MAVSAVSSEFKHPYEGVNNQIDKTNEFYVAKKSTDKKAGQSLDMTDFLTLMVAMFQNQDIDNPADTSTMMTQMVQMSVIQAITDISQLISDSTNMTYGASLIGKEVTIGIYNDTFTDLQEITGVVTGTGQQDGKQVIFIGNDTYLVSDIIAVGRLPDKEDGDKVDGTKPGDSTEGSNKPEGTDKPEGGDQTEAPDGTEGGSDAGNSGADTEPKE